jgi:hypothetical protein
MHSMPLIRRSALLAACAVAALIPAALAGQNGLRLMPYGGLTPFSTVAAGGQVGIPVTEHGSVFADYSLWGFGMHCMELHQSGSTSRCNEAGWSLNGGGTYHAYDATDTFRPYVSLGGGISRLTAPSRRADTELSLLGETGFEVGGYRPLNLRVGLRWQGRPSVGTDYAGPVVGLRLALW